MPLITANLITYILYLLPIQCIVYIIPPNTTLPQEYYIFPRFAYSILRIDIFIKQERALSISALIAWNKLPYTIPSYKITRVLA